MTQDNGELEVRGELSRGSLPVPGYTMPTCWRPNRPVKKANLEHVGVKPGISTAPVDALCVTYKWLLTNELVVAMEENQRKGLKLALSRLQNGKWDVPDDKPIKAN